MIFKIRSALLLGACFDLFGSGPVRIGTNRIEPWLWAGGLGDKVPTDRGDQESSFVSWVGRRRFAELIDQFQFAADKFGAVGFDDVRCNLPCDPP